MNYVITDYYLMLVVIGAVHKAEAPRGVMSSPRIPRAHCNSGDDYYIQVALRYVVVCVVCILRGSKFILSFTLRRRINLDAYPAPRASTALSNLPHPSALLPFYPSAFLHTSIPSIDVHNHLHSKLVPCRSISISIRLLLSPLPSTTI